MTRKEPLYICLSDNGKDLFLLPKSEVEASIKNMEEDANSDLEYSILGGIKQPYPKVPFLLTYKTSDSDVVLYDVIYADNSFDSHMALYNKARLKDKSIKITNTLNLTKLIDEYYE